MMNGRFTCTIKKGKVKYQRELNSFVKTICTIGGKILLVGLFVNLLGIRKRMNRKVVITTGTTATAAEHTILKIQPYPGRALL